MYRIILCLLAAVMVNGQSSTTLASAEPSTPWWWPTSGWWETTSYAPPPSPKNTDCTCTFKNTWLDVYFAIDASNSMGNDGINGAVNYILSVLLGMTVGQQIGQCTRVGFIFYADNAVVHSTLNTYSSISQVMNDLLPTQNKLLNSSGTNIEDAISKAAASFTQGLGHRPNVQQVLVVLAAAYKEGGYNDPLKSAEIFKSSYGKIIAIEYVQEHGLKVDYLRDIASPGFFLSNSEQDLQLDDLRYLFCYANCFCAKNYKQYDRSSIFDVPTGGCFGTETLPSVEFLAESNCEITYQNGTLPKILNLDDANFLTNLTASRTQVWIGLTRDSLGSPWHWQDGTSLSGYQPWGVGEPSNAGNCVIQAVTSGFSPNWYVRDCTEGYLYSCQTAPCSSDIYCSDTIEFKQKEPQEK